MGSVPPSGSSGFALIYSTTLLSELGSVVLRGRRRTGTLRESGANSWLLTFYKESIGLPRLPLLGRALVVPTELTDALCAGVGGFSVGRRIVGVKRAGGPLLVVGVI